MSSKVSLGTIPDDVVVEILERADFLSIQSLRKVCHNFRNIIDDNKIDTKLFSINISVKSDIIQLEFVLIGEKPRNKIEYQNYGVGCVRVIGKTKKVFENEDFVTVFVKDFNFLLRNQKSVLGWFGIDQGDLVRNHRCEDSVINPVLDQFKGILESRKEKLKVEKFKITVSDKDQVLSILPHLKSESLKSIWIQGVSFEISPKTIEFSEIMMLDQWKSADKVLIMARVPNISVLNSGSFTTAIISCELVTPEELAALKEALLQTTKFQQLRIKYSEFNLDYMLPRLLGPMAHEYPEKWRFPIPKTNQILQIQHDKGSKEITFSRKYA